ncbi:MAG TPA: BON domain-containing protein [Candidatus Angelobacter sp.]|nr:BON domain-containing protein [Candidatus Angelobacter sp.]
MKHFPVKLAILAILALAAIQANSQQPQSQSPPPASDQSQQAHPAEAPPHVDAEPNPEDRALEQSIKDELKKDPHMVYSSVAVHVTDTEVKLTGTVKTGTAKQQAAKIAGEHAGSRKVDNHIRVNPNMHPGPGL